MKRFFKKIGLRYQIKKYGVFLLREGLRELHNRGTNINLGLEGRAVARDDNLSYVYLRQNKNGQIDDRPIIALGIEKHQKEGRKYVVYSKMLTRLEKGC